MSVKDIVDTINIRIERIREDDKLRFRHKDILIREYLRLLKWLAVFNEVEEERMKAIAEFLGVDSK